MLRVLASRCFRRLISRRCTQLPKKNRKKEWADPILHTFLTSPPHHHRRSVQHSTRLHYDGLFCLLLPYEMRTCSEPLERDSGVVDIHRKMDWLVFLDRVLLLCHRVISSDFRPSAYLYLYLFHESHLYFSLCHVAGCHHHPVVRICGVRRCPHLCVGLGWSLVRSASHLCKSCRVGLSRMSQGLDGVWKDGRWP